MKVASKEEVQEYSAAIVHGFFKGAIIGTATSVGLWAVLRKRSGFYQTLTATTRTFFSLAPPIGLGVLNAEWASRKFDQAKYKFGEASEIAQKEKKDYEDLPLKDRLAYDLAENKYKVITGLWAASLGGSFWIVNRDKFLSKSQKLVQARMYAQALTVGLLLGSMFLSMKSYNVVVEEKEVDNSWKEIVAEEEEREVKAGLPLRLANPHDHSHKHHKEEAAVADK